jgi:ferritin-like metal-binding protein YciE
VLGSACAVAMQRITAERNFDVPADRRILLRIGVNLGDIIHDRTRAFTATVSSSTSFWSGMAEGEETLKEFGDSPALDTALVAAGQAVEHYEMARYGALIGWAKQLKMGEAVSLLNETLEEEMKADKLLTQIGASMADQEAIA